MAQEQGLGVVSCAPAEQETLDGFVERQALRVARGLSQTAAAADAGMAPNTFRVWEIDPSKVSAKNQAKGRAFLARLRARAAQVAA
ncbi:MAG: hypothetical protein WDO74_22340 [Pseudomonadota bacterium]